MTPKERPVIMTAESVRAILAGTKTQTRRVAKARDPIEMIGPRGTQDDPASWGYFFDGPAQHGWMVLERGRNEDFDGGRVSIPCPYGDIGDRVWIREGFALAPLCLEPNPEDQDDWSVVYRAHWDGSLWRSSLDDDANDVKPPWRSPLYMPRWASRIALEITEVRVERLQAINEDDARSEGVERDTEPCDHTRILCEEIGCLGPTYRSMYAERWDAINGKRAAWSSNPFVWAISFRRIP